LILGTLAAFAASQTSCDKLNELTGKSSDKAEKDDGEKKKKKKKDDDETEEEDDQAPTASATASASAAPEADAGPTDAGDDAAAAADDAAVEEEEEDSDATNADTITRYDDEVPQGGTVRLKVPFKAYQAADITSKELASLAIGTFVNLKASHSNWMLIEYPSGIAELSLGWIQLKNRYDKTAVEDAQAPPDSALSRPKDAAGRKDGGKKRDGGLRLRFPRRDK
jgi:hypothetical protein